MIDCKHYHPDSRHRRLCEEGKLSAPHAAQPPAPRFQLGDAVESALSKVGVTKERVEDWLGRPCGCVERQKRLNDLSEWAQVTAGQAVETARGWLGRLLGSQPQPRPCPEQDAARQSTQDMIATAKTAIEGSGSNPPLTHEELLET